VSNVSKRKICVVTGTRAEYGLLLPLLRALKGDSAFELQLIATAAHLSPEFGLTYRIIEEDGFAIDAKVEMLLSSDTAVGIAKSIGLGTIGFADAFDRLRPDLLVLLGDRFEMLAAAQAALVARLPIAHIGGGDTTEGAFDEAIRHSITKMSQLHFVTNQESADRVLQLGEETSRVFVAGNLGIDLIKEIELLPRAEVEKRIGFKFRRKNLLLTFHPVTLQEDYGLEEFESMLSAVDRLGNNYGMIFTRPNADTYGRAIVKRLDRFVATHENASVHTSLGSQMYLSTMASIDVVVGNSSSALYEAPTFQKPSVDIGERQSGRLRANSVIHCEARAEDIHAAIIKGLSLDCSDVVNPYGDGNSVPRILAVLKNTPDYNVLLKKHFVLRAK
jgi:UDP-N-acetylglucosamine 2-epimerase (non-hydrolysing)/GDP/UDP-N,N'-diacetylbacillosamine 2-epimerase (hydrolysing)